MILGGIESVSQRERTMISIRTSSERGHASYDWLDTRHTFSFDTYHDPRFMNFRSLRVLNEDRVVPGAGFPTHGHRDMEIITYVLEGSLEHRDSLGNGSIILPGDGQRMTAGRGIRHSELNPSPSEPVHLLQIWILPERNGLDPGYEQKSFLPEQKQGRLCLLAAPAGWQGEKGNGHVSIHQDVFLYASVLREGEQVVHELAPGRHAWLQVARGAVQLNGSQLGQGDGAAVSDEATITVRATEDSEVLLFDLA
jgi:redox-sensitive bicupin YhaK (pirin superfamily)